jgi:hypothetical protein
MLDTYINALAAAPLAPQTRRTYTSKVRQYLAWLASTDLDSDPLDGPDAGTGPYATTAPTSRRSSSAAPRP